MMTGKAKRMKYFFITGLTILLMAASCVLFCGCGEILNEDSVINNDNVDVIDNVNETDNDNVNETDNDNVNETDIDSVNETDIDSVNETDDGTWKQKEFIIGAYDGVRLTGKYEEDLDILKTMSDSGINMMVQSQYWYTTRYFDRSSKKFNLDAVSNKYILELTADFNKKYGKDKMRLIVLDNRIANENIPVNKPYSAEKFKDYLEMAPELREVLYGYSLMDEPTLKRLKECLPAIASAKEIDREKMIFVNLGDTESDFRECARLLAENSSILSFDKYHFVTDSKVPSRKIADSYFRYAQIIAEEAKKANIPWWGVPLCIEHEKRGEYGKIYWGHRIYDPNNRNPKLELGRIRFSAYAAIIYGAKGITWYSYDTPNNPISNPDRIEEFRDPNIPYCFYEGCLDYDGKPTIIYDYVKEVNTKLLSMGPVLMDLRWITTVHKMYYNNDGEIPSDKLPVVADSITEDNTLAVGVFEGGDRNKYLIVMNKNLDIDKTYTIALREIKAVSRFNCKTKEWEEQEINGSDSIVLDVESADIELLKLIEK